MKTQIQNQLLEHSVNRSSHSAFNQQGQTSINRSIEQKIEDMSKSLAQGVSSPSTAMDTLKKLQTQRQQHQRHITQVQKQMFSDLNAMEKSLLNFDREKMLHRASSKIMEEMIQERLDDFEYDLKKLDDNSHQKQSQYRDKISNLKVEMVELEHICHQKVDKFQRDTSNKLITLEKNFQSQQLENNELNDLMIKGFKEVRGEIEGETRKLIQQKRKFTQKIAEIQEGYAIRVQQQKKRQKEAFQQHYKTLQAIFRLLEQEVK